MSRIVNFRVFSELPKQVQVVYRVCTRYTCTYGPDTAKSRSPRLTCVKAQRPPSTEGNPPTRNANTAAVFKAVKTPPKRSPTNTPRNRTPSGCSPLTTCPLPPLALLGPASECGGQFIVLRFPRQQCPFLQYFSLFWPFSPFTQWL